MDYIESDMDFAPLFNSPSKHTFYIEKSAFYKKTTNLKTVEFVTIELDDIHFIEAKKSVPRDQVDLSVFCETIYEKFYHSLNLMVTNELGVGKYEATDLPNNFEALFKKRQVNFILIINGMPKIHCTPVKEALERRFYSNKALSLIWEVKVLVYNHEISREKNFIN